MKFQLEQIASQRSVAFCGRKLKGDGEVYSCYIRHGIVHIKKKKKKETFEST